MTPIDVSSLAYAMILWINSSGLVTPALPSEPIAVQQVDPAHMALEVQRCLVLGGGEAVPESLALERAGALYGLYCGNRISLSGELDMNTPQAQSVLVHELVHWIQDYNGDDETAACVQALEADAYRINRVWQAQLGMELFPKEDAVQAMSRCE